MKGAISYIRVSSEEQADTGLGLEAQRQRIAACCAMKGLHLAEVFGDPDISGGKPLASRPAGSKLLAAAKKGQALVIVSKLDRLFRSVADAATVIADFDKKGIQRVAITETRFYVLSATRGITKEISFPHPLAHPLMGGKRLLKVIRVIDTSQTAAKPLGSLATWPRHNFVGPARRQSVWRPDFVILRETE